MKLDRAIQLQRQFEQYMRSTFSDTVFFERTLDAHIEAVKRLITETPQYKKCPQYVHAYVRGVESQLWHELYSVRWGFKSRELTPQLLPVLEYVNIGTDGKQFRENDNSWLKESSEYKSAMQGKHAWRSSLDRNQVKFWS